ncbi:MAG: membrane protein insertase YidC [Schleiferiaceae bacterium]|nr:membrane protein insertase YidC [Schleiferiaceae bacterium]
MENQNKGLDKNQIIGFILIAAIMGVFGWWQSKNAPEVPVEPAATESTETVSASELVVSDNPSTENIAAIDNNAFLAEEFVIENTDLILTFSTQGARLVSAQIKGFSTYTGDSLFVVNQNQTMDLILPGAESLGQKGFTIDTRSSSGAVLTDGATKVRITLPEKGYDFNWVVSGTAAAAGKPELFWERTAMRTEKGISNERIYSTYSYKVTEDGDIENMSGRGGDDSEALGAVDWLAQKQHFFSFIAHPEAGFSEVQAATVNGGDEDESIVKKFSSTATLNTTVDGSYTLPFTFYIGPNHYQTLKDYDQGYEKVINFGWGIFGWIGRGVVVPIFNWLEGYGLGYGLIILIMVLIIKGAMSPLTFASYRSMAKMRVLKPQLDEMNKKFGEKDAVAKQQAQMALYKEAGVNPLGGCIPVIVQMPILIAMFRFFPASIELRGESFLWATDLSTYDALISWDQHIPLISSFYGNHISIFTLLMTASTILYTRMNQQMTAGTGSSEQMKQMQIIMYVMPLMFMFVLNSYPAGLTYYYFLSNIITFAMQWGIRRSVNDEAILAKIEEKKAQPKAEKKKSKFQGRLEEMQRQQNLNRSQRRK